MNVRVYLTHTHSHTLSHTRTHSRTLFLAAAASRDHDQRHLRSGFVGEGNRLVLGFSAARFRRSRCSWFRRSSAALEREFDHWSNSSSLSPGSCSLSRCSRCSWSRWSRWSRCSWFRRSRCSWFRRSPEPTALPLCPPRCCCASRPARG